MKLTKIMDQGPYRFVHTDKRLENGKLDYRIQKYNTWTQRYNDMYLLDSSLQLDACLEDKEYTKWLDPDPEVSAYKKRGDVVRSPYK